MVFVGVTLSFLMLRSGLGTEFDIVSTIVSLSFVIPPSPPRHPPLYCTLL